MNQLLQDYRKFQSANETKLMGGFSDFELAQLTQQKVAENLDPKAAWPFLQTLPLKQGWLTLQSEIKVLTSAEKCVEFSTDQAVLNGEFVGIDAKTSWLIRPALAGGVDVIVQQETTNNDNNASAYLVKQQKVYLKSPSTPEGKANYALYFQTNERGITHAALSRFLGLTIKG